MVRVSQPICRQCLPGIASMDFRKACIKLFPRRGRIWHSESTSKAITGRLKELQNLYWLAVDEKYRRCILWPHRMIDLFSKNASSVLSCLFGIIDDHCEEGEAPLRNVYGSSKPLHPAELRLYWLRPSRPLRFEPAIAELATRWTSPTSPAPCFAD